MWLLDHMVRLCLVFKKLPDYLPKWLYYFTFLLFWILIFFSLMCNENFQSLRGNPSIASFQIIAIFQSFAVIWINSIFLTTFFYWGGQELACNTGDLGSIPGLRGSPGEGNSYPLQYSYLENSMDRGAWQATVHRISKSQTWMND